MCTPTPRIPSSGGFWLPITATSREGSTSSSKSGKGGCVAATVVERLIMAGNDDAVECLDDQPGSSILLDRRWRHQPAGRVVRGADQQRIAADQHRPVLGGDGKRHMVRDMAGSRQNADARWRID